MPKREARMVSLGYGKYVRADKVFAVVPLEAGERPALTEAAGIPRPRGKKGQEGLF